jgi:hypothetical protein
MAHPSEMTTASRLIEYELGWLDDQDYTGLSGGERRSLYANHLVSVLDDNGFSVENYIAQCGICAQSGHTSDTHPVPEPSDAGGDS